MQKPYKQKVKCNLCGYAYISKKLPGLKDDTMKK